MHKPNPGAEGARRYRMNVAYDGAGYAGWQIQPNGLSVQQVLEETLKRLTGAPVKVHGSGRTDQGVHARKQVAHFDLARPWPTRKLRVALNALLPADIRVMAVAPVERTFHARKSVREKEYRYLVWSGEILPPFLRQYRLHVPRALDVAAMRQAAARLAGTLDFAAFTANAKREVESTVRRVSTLEVRKRGNEIAIVVRGEGFLYKMVRSLAGFIVKVGEGRAAPEDAVAILASRKRTARVPTAPAQGLFLWDVLY